ncbi:uncharacterized protein NESG_02447 [Nematocida ausubeli]|uniref:EF-hand domain-containing protein n=1 Tax=Nematocida ausubeli (strain ATCC PRA-371 / ERTm2) TaxID=1913371 RepID=H8ZAC2_NEMA1|nr:uncharacterized protein NESG_02447 [Nematocida ausubeli]EHY66903.1 hypothetical protein NERG_00543 [Nematocida ausubeli]KAI5132273.1 hypothetical protein NEAUS06_0062 [Nematocida ausubeli]KAI5133554.1 hypothetical protein NEAUS07_0448 [Nematocida ausubeli]KAI5147194.1 hypothetical protein NEAUS05_0516 [Nematocida ausubeli]KFG25125.1 hypothetical protein NESG_02447 [Nematocida ausubeli]
MHNSPEEKSTHSGSNSNEMSSKEMTPSEEVDSAADERNEDNFNWFEDTADFGFEDVDDLPKHKSITKTISKRIIPATAVLIGLGILSLVLLNFIPLRMREVHGFLLKHIIILIIILAFLLILTKLVIHGAYILCRDNITDNNILHNKKLKLKIVFGCWFFEMIPVGIQISGYIPWARTILDRIFVCGFLSILALIGKGILIELFRERFLSGSLKDKAKDVEIKNRIINTMREYCYEEQSEEIEQRLSSCFLVSCLNGDEDDASQNNNEGMDFIKGDVDSVIGDVFTKSIFEKNQMTQHEILSLARDVFTKCSKNQKYITFNDFCEIFPSSQAAIQAFLYFDISDDKNISRKEIRDTLGMFHYNRKNLQTSFHSLNNFIVVLDNLALIVTIIPLIVLYLIVLGFPVKQLLAFSLSSALILNFFISGVAKDFWLNTSFVITHPYDIGDDVIIDGKDYVIYRTSLYKTEVLAIDGGKISFLNKALWNKSIINMTRAPHKLIHITFSLTPLISKEKFKVMKKHILQYLRAKNDIFYETFTIQSETETVCKIQGHTCVLVTRCRSLGSKMAKLEQKIELVRYLKELLKELKVEGPAPKAKEKKK